jgi:hypothetical protein
MIVDVSEDVIDRKLDGDSHVTIIVMEEDRGIAAAEVEAKVE